MGKTIAKLLVLGLMMGIGLIPAEAQTSITLTGSEPLTFTGYSTNGITVDLGSCGGGGCLLAGSTMGSVSGSTAYSFNLFTGEPILATTSGTGTFTAWSGYGPGLVGSMLGIDGLNGTLLFLGTLTDLTFSQSASGSPVQMAATATPSSGASVSLSGTINVGSGELSGLPGTNGSTSGPIVPEPASMMLFGSGLILLGGVLRRRKAPADQAGRNNAAPVTPPLAGLQS